MEGGLSHNSKSHWVSTDDSLKEPRQKLQGVKTKFKRCIREKSTKKKENGQ